MSSITYEEMLREALVDLSEMQEQDMQSVGLKLGGPGGAAKDLSYFSNHWAPMYLRYVQIARNLEKVHDQILQPQKRHDARVLLDSCIGRMLEMKKRVVEVCGGYFSFDEILVDLKLTPEALEIPIPRYFIEERFEELSERRQYVRSLIDHYVRTEPDAPVSLAADAANAAPVVTIGKGASAFTMPERQPMSLEEAVLVLQCNERGRQGRQTAKFHRTIFEQEMHQHREFEYGSTTGKDQAATRIQKIALGYLARKHVKTMLANELEFLGMAPSQQVLSNAPRDKARKVMVERKMRQANNVAELAQEAKALRARIKLQEGGRTMEEMLDEVLEKMARARLADPSDLLPTFPTEEEGGSLALLGRRVLKPEEIAIAKAQREEAERLAKAEAKKKDNTRKKDTDEERPVLGGSIFWDVFTEARDRYANVWHSKFQGTYLDKKDFDQRFDKDLLRQEVTEGPGGTEVELRRCVDQLVMVEVANLRERMEAQMGVKKKKPKKPKVKKVKLPKDPSDGAKLESFINTAVYLGVLQLPDESLRVQDYLGAHDMMGPALLDHLRANGEQADAMKGKWEALLKNWNPFVEQSLGMTKDVFEALFQKYCNPSTWMFEPSAVHVRQAVTETCILPLGSQTVSDLCSFAIRGGSSTNTCLLYGFKGSGKTMLSHAICNESGANFFNLSPRHFNPGTGSAKIIQMVFRLARALAPSVIYIDEAELLFVSRKAARADPVASRAIKMKKEVINCIKDLQPTDRVLVLGNSRKPWTAGKDMAGFWKQVICCVHPDYASRMELWQKLLHRKGAVLPNYNDYEILAHITNKYTSGVIAGVINETLTERRLRRLAHRPLQIEEFLPALSRATPIYKEEYDMMSAYSATLPLAMRHSQAADYAEPVDPKAKPAPRKPAPKKA